MSYFDLHADKIQIVLFTSFLYLLMSGFLSKEFV